MAESTNQRSEISASTHLNQPKQNDVPDSNALLMGMFLEVLQKLSSAKDLETIMFIVRRAARKIASADGATFVLRDGDKCYYADEDAIGPLWKGKRFPMKICISGWVMEHKQPVVIEDIYSDSRIPTDAYRPTFVKSLTMVPIRTNDPIGAIGAYWAENYLPSEEQVSLLKALADSTSVAMENIQLQSKIDQGSKETSEQVEISRKLMDANKNLESTLAELNHKNQEMLWLKELTSQLQTCIYIEEAYQLIAKYLQKLLPGLSGIFYIMHPSRNHLESMIDWGELSTKEKIIKPEDCLALRRGSIYHVNDPDKNLICAHCKQNSTTPHIYSCIPLFAQSDILGLLYLEWSGSNDQKDFYAKEENQNILASMISEQIAIGISNIKLRETLRNQSLRDALTGLFNRRYLEETLEREMSRCQRKNVSLALMMIDIDHFKQFNDQYGHEAGDIVIQSLANRLRNFARKSDIACRYGGEEFILVIPEITLEGAIARAKALHEEIDQIHLRYGGVALGTITISIGLAMYPEHAENMRDLITNSDQALYEAKNSGRNTTIIFKKS